MLQKRDIKALISTQKKFVSHQSSLILNLLKVLGSVSKFYSYYRAPTKALTIKLGIQRRVNTKNICFGLLISGAGGGTLSSLQGIISELTLCFYYNHACVVHVNKAHNSQ